MGNIDELTRLVKKGGYWDDWHEMDDIANRADGMKQIAVERYKLLLETKLGCLVEFLEKRFPYNEWALLVCMLSERLGKGKQPEKEES